MNLIIVSSFFELNQTWFYFYPCDGTEVLVYVPCSYAGQTGTEHTDKINSALKLSL